MKSKSQFIGRADRGLVTSKLSHNFNGTIVSFAGCDKKRAGLSPRCNIVSESALSKFIRIFRHNDTHWSNADRLPKFYVKAADGIVADWHKLHITSGRSGTTVISEPDAGVSRTPVPDKMCLEQAS
jgi:hypothetical protein